MMVRKVLQPNKQHLKNTLDSLVYFHITNDNCWEYFGCEPDVCGYMRISLGGIRDYVHRWIWKIFIGPIPEGLYVCHICDNRICINPDHLFLGTHSDNLRDMHHKGRGYKRKPNDTKQKVNSACYRQAA